MTAAAPETGSSVGSVWPLPGPGAPAEADNDRKHAKTQAHGSGSSTGEHVGQQPWWRRRFVLWALALVAVLLVTFIVLLVLGLLGYLKPSKNPRIELGYATYIGQGLDGGIDRYLGMRYAAPPVGNLRWRAPAAPLASDKPQQATSFGTICLGISAVFPSPDQSEDCLFVNVWAPSGARNTSKLPVWVFIQGGGYTINANANWDGEEVVRQSGNKIVFVNFNYRVALWGFLASSKIRADGNLNAGLLDQRFLLQWVKSHIASFGGDPDNVIIHGTSAGAGSVAMHLMAYGGRDDKLFTAAMGESLFFPAQPLVNQLEYQFDRLANSTGCAPQQDQLACLRGLNTIDLQAQNAPNVFPGRTQPPLPLFYWTPCVDGDFLRDLPYNLVAQRKLVDVPLLFGNDNDEGSGFAIDAATPEQMSEFFQNNYPLLTSRDASAITAAYPLMPPLPLHQAWFPSTSMAYGEATFTCPTITLYSALQNRPTNATSPGSPSTSSPMWLYRYNVIDKENIAAGLGVPHVFEAYAVFGPASLASPNFPKSYVTYNAPIVPVVMRYFLSFVQTHDPNPLRAPGSPEWAKWGDGGDGGGARGRGVRLVLETNNTRMEEVGPEQAMRCSFWAGLAPRTQQKMR